ncbi:lysine-2,3-aminomutase-like protein [Magnetospirillum sulfuroxidans]|uniref:Lysine-2,3-aminomutase-like protein n=1 Tax=Magnetospirillum sulfuroxidans TaxID=611300 RepID=A0ABS5IGM5_9PROT|nr:lysine-2,3-aminomutase-like protein [Magnetospirillum sulfuroxidans]MBR9973489.1 lysine-2,3-aminomutase-like protein [Magnetospirillum sulfuroxidans]
MNIDKGVAGHITRSLRRVDDLIEAGLATQEQRPALEALAHCSVIAITPAVVELINGADPADPIARQYVPNAAELQVAAEELADPIGDDAYSPVKGIVHRYPDRALLKPILVCPVYCRFCFRREAVGDADGTLSPAELDAAFAYLAGRPELREIIVTGGDPLMLNAPRLADLVARVSALPHIEVLRFHSRVPVADPERVTAVLAAALGSPDSLAVWVSVHVNHPRELSAPARAALKRLADAGVPLISQSVLLKGVNDDPAILEELFRALIRNRVRPYYLHHPDLTRGTSHFRPSIAEGQAIMRALRGRLSGIAQPTYVLDIPGGAGKVPLGPDWWDDERGEVTDWRGRRHPYPG